MGILGHLEFLSTISVRCEGGAIANVLHCKAWGQNILVRGYDRFAPRLPQVGTTIRPSPAVLTDWASYVTTAFESGPNPTGGWAPGRSQLVAWGLQTKYLYRACDDGEWDLLWLMQPEDRLLHKPLHILQRECNDLHEEFMVAVDTQVDRYYKTKLRGKPEAERRRFKEYARRYKYHEQIKHHVALDDSLRRFHDAQELLPHGPLLPITSLPPPGEVVSTKLGMPPM